MLWLCLWLPWQSSLFLPGSFCRQEQGEERREPQQVDSLELLWVPAGPALSVGRFLWLCLWLPWQCSLFLPGSCRRQEQGDERREPQQEESLELLWAPAGRAL